MLILTHRLRFNDNYYFSGNDLYCAPKITSNMHYVGWRKLRMQLIKNSSGIISYGYYINGRFRTINSINKQRLLICKILLDKSDVKLLPF